MMGDVFLIAKVASNPLPVAFKLIKCGDGMAVFENTAHDFPKRLAYQKHADNDLSVEVSGDGGDGFTLAYKRKVHAVN